MIVFQDTAGQLFKANSPTGVVRKMRQAAWQVPGKRQYMLDVAKRISILDGGKSEINIASPDEFLDSLVHFGWLIKLQ